MVAKPRWGFLDIIIVYLGILGTGIIVSLLGSNIPQIAAGFGLGDIGFFLFAFLLQFLATIGLVYIMAVVVAQGSWSDLGIKSTHPNNYLEYGVLGGVLLVILVVFLGAFIKQFQPELPPQYYEEMLRSAGNLPVFIPVFLAGVVLAPISEEIFYRGMVYPVFREYLGPFWGAIGAGLIFGLAHWDLWRALPLSIGGAVLCYIYEKTGSIWVPAVAHGIWNGTMALAVYLSIFKGLV
ncbi:CAAX amino terminal protease [Syntrophomonas zehnderi OL-4]|uniref:CAAX amino terminal protease n=1 Tax=Syntrophomonas zehnderi OL-4 TaxID=690567 RepID=A0A0E4GCM6_9FIRM|nr:CPBP family intramembrane glutamic endopeptidase [Syntrophomonas zehnderi]CFX85019.1 CAAX amino terminal protease [Syntrophomonas zehnderi OL-4]